MIKLENVRMAYPSLWSHSQFEGESTGKYEATFLVPKDDKKSVKKLEDAIAEIKKTVKVSSSKIFAMQDGDEKDNEAFHGHWLVKAKSTKRVKVEDRNRDPLTEEDEKIYSGARVNALVRLYGSPKYKCVSSNLYAVQFVEHDEPIGFSVDLDEYFEDMGDGF